MYLGYFHMLFYRKTQEIFLDLEKFLENSENLLEKLEKF